jgi:hypothetical protein
MTTAAIITMTLGFIILLTTYPSKKNFVSHSILGFLVVLISIIFLMYSNAN